VTDYLPELRTRIAKAPQKPGVYRWLGTDGTVLYVGKAKNLRNRLRSYVQKDAASTLGPWKTSLMTKVTDVDMTVTENELEALILETNLIKEIKPKYNVLMKDDKNYVYVRIGTKLPYPTIDVVRQMSDDGAKYFGPFLSSYDLNRTLDLLHDIFRFRACSASIDALNAGRTPQRACVEAQIGQCNGLCSGKMEQDDYRKSIDEVMRFLKGDRGATITELKRLMQDAAAGKKFERAAKLRDVLAHIASLEEQQVVSGTDGNTVDVIGIAFMGNGKAKAQAVVLRIRNGKLIEERSIMLSGETEDMREGLEQFIPQYYAGETDIPEIIVIADTPEGIVAINAWLVQRRGGSVEIRVPERGKKSKLLAMAEDNARRKIEQQFAKWESAVRNVETALQELQKALNLKEAPKRIEGYDISHLGGTETVGSMVVMKNGKPANAEYRSFTLRTVHAGEIDDYKALREVLRRRLKHCAPKTESAITVKKLPKKERVQWREGKTTLAMPKGWREELLMVSEDNRELLTMDLRRKNPKTPLYAFAHFQAKKTDALHRTLDAVEHALGKSELYLVIPETIDEDILALHGFLPSAKPVPEEFTPPTNTRTYHRRKTVADPSLSAAPDLLVIDGGKGQLGAVLEVLKELSVEIPVIGLAKREEEIFLPKSSLPVNLPKDSQAQYLLQRLRDEAHRFANAHREKRLLSKEIGSALDAVPGIGPETKKALLSRFGSVDNVKHASDVELLTVLNTGQLEALRKEL